MPVPTALYRHFDADGNLLYVGISLNAVARLAQHRLTASWFTAITRIEVQWYPSRADAEASELDAIQTERPRHNLKHALPPALLALLEGHPKAHMVGTDGMLKPEFASLAPGEAERIAQLLG